MQRPNFYTDQLVLSDDLNYIISAVSTELARRIQGNLGYSGGFNETALSAYSRNKAGVLGSPGDYLLTKNLKVAPGGSTSQLTIYNGSALSTGGELIYIDSTQTLIRGTSNANYNWTTTVGTNYVKLSYIESSGSIKTDFSGIGYPTRYTSSWYVNIDSVAPLSTEILLATFTGDGSGNVTVSSIVDTRLYTRVYTFADAVGLDTYNIPVSTHKNVGDHIRATGSGVASNANPHGMSYDDISGSTSLLTGLHATELHVNCIVPLLRTTGCYASYAGTIVNPTSNASISFTAPSTAFIIINGHPFSGSLASLSAIDAYNIAGNGNYYAVADVNGVTSWKSTLTIDNLFSKTVESVARYSTGHMNKDYYILGIATVADNGDDITAWQDSRIFYGTHQVDIGADYDEAVGDPNSGTYTLTRGSTLIDNLLRMRYQLGKAINGTGSTTSWKTATPPLTSGPSSNADSYHAHTFDNLTDTKAAGITVSDIGLSAYNMYQLNGVSIASSESSNYWVLNSTTTTTAYALMWKDKETGTIPGISPLVGIGINFATTGWYEIEAGLQIVPSGTALVHQYFLQLDLVEVVGTGSTVINSSISSLIDIDAAGFHAEYTENALPIRNKIYYKAEVASGSVNPSTVFVQVRPYIYSDAGFTLPVILYKPTYSYTETVDDGVRNISCAFQNFLSVKKIKNL